MTNTAESLLQALLDTVPGRTAEAIAEIVAPARVSPFPEGPFRFFALDVETANNHRGSLCQIGVACVRADNTIETWVTLVDPETDVWIWSGLHGITAGRVQGAPTFAEVLPVLEAALEGSTVYQHSGFDRSAIAAACADAGLSAPAWLWRDSVQVARAAWPELKGNGGHGLASLKVHLGLEFHHHDAGEDARAAAEVVLRAEGVGLTISVATRTMSTDTERCVGGDEHSRSAAIPASNGD